jgi:hypothetical protein
LWLNLAAAIGLAGMAWVCTRVTGDVAQWAALGVGVYATVSWMQAIALRDPPAARLILRTPSLRFACFGFSLLSFTGYGLGYWMAPFFMRFHAVSAADAGLVLGGTAAAAGWLGVTFGGVFADRWRQRTRRGRLYMGMLTAVCPLPLAVWALTTPSTTVAYVLNFPLTASTAMWIGAGASTVQDLVLPRMRAMAAAVYILVVTFVGLALGPYTIGPRRREARLGNGIAPRVTLRRLCEDTVTLPVWTVPPEISFVSGQP